jgi:hypothetical protein
MFKDFFQLGVEHILSLSALDHICFIVALTALSTLKNWRRLLVLITAFTIGHSITLVLSTFSILKVKSSITEFFIPLTIIATALYNIIVYFKNKKPVVNYWMALFFGCIHGLGFAGALKSLLGRGQSIALPLFAFNTGIEAAQIILVLGILLIGYLVMKKLPQKYWALGLSYGCLLLACYLAIRQL